MTKAFVTGGTGIVGARLLFDLLKRGKRVIANKRESSKTYHVKKAFEFYDFANGLELFNEISWVNGDITDLVSMLEFIDDCDEVYHAAALVSFRQKDKDSLMQINQKGTANIIDACLENGVKKLGYISSVSALERKSNGDLITESREEEEKNRSNYGHSKFTAELEVWRGIEEGLNAVIVNPSLIIGAGRPELSSGMLYKKIIDGLKFYGPGINGIVDVRTVSDVCIRLVEQNVFGERFILSGHNISQKLLFETIANAVGQKPPRHSLSRSSLKFLSKMASFISFLGMEPPIGRESLESATKVLEYDNSKISRFLEVEYPSIEDSIGYFARYYKELLND